MFNFLRRKRTERIVKYVAPRSGKVVDCSINNPTHKALAGLDRSQVEYVPTFVEQEKETV